MSTESENAADPAGQGSARDGDTGAQGASQSDKDQGSESALSAKEQELNKTIASLEKHKLKLEKENKEHRDKSKSDQEEASKKALEKAEKDKNLQEIINLKTSKINELELLSPEIEKLKNTNTKMLENFANLLKAELKKLTPDQIKEFEKLFGFVDDPILKHTKLTEWLPTVTGNNVPNSANSPPASQGNKDDPKKKALLKQAISGTWTQKQAAKNQLREMGVEV